MRPRSRPACLRPVAALIAAAASAGAAGQDGGRDQAEQHSLGVFTGSADSVLAQLSYVQFDRNAITRLDPFTLLQDGMRRLNNAMDRAARLRVGFAWTAVYQHGDPALGPRDAAGADFDFFGRWRPLQTRSTLGYVIFQTEARYTLGTDIPPKALGVSIGSQWGTTNGFNTKSFQLKQIFWQQFLFNNTLTYRVGKLDLSATFNVNALSSDNFFFLSAAIADNLTMPYPANGPAFDLTWRPDPNFYLAFGIADGDEQTIHDNPDKRLRDVNWFTVAELGVTPWIDDVGGGRYRFTIWHSDAEPSAREPGSQGLAVSIDQELGGQYLGFLRYGLSDGRLTDTRQTLSTGFGVKRPFSNLDDFAGVAVAWGQPSDRGRRDQFMIEGFYRLQLTPAIQVTPDVQFIVHPSNAPAEDTVWVLGVRVRISI